MLPASSAASAEKPASGYRPRAPSGCRELPVRSCFAGKHPRGLRRGDRRHGVGGGCSSAVLVAHVSWDKRDCEADSSPLAIRHDASVADGSCKWHQRRGAITPLKNRPRPGVPRSHGGVPSSAPARRSPGRCSGTARVRRPSATPASPRARTRLWFRRSVRDLGGGWKVMTGGTAQRCSPR